MKNCEGNCGCECSLTESLKESSVAIWLLALCAFLLGIIVGFVFSPTKNGVSIGNGNKSFEGCNIAYNDDDDTEACER